MGCRQLRSPFLLFVITTLCIGFGFPDEAFAKRRRKAITARLSAQVGEGVYLHPRFKINSKRASRPKLELERAGGGSSTFRKLVEISDAQPTMTIVDRPKRQGRYLYRARVVAGPVRSRWTKPVEVDVAQGQTVDNNGDHGEDGDDDQLKSEEGTGPVAVSTAPLAALTLPAGQRECSALTGIIDPAQVLRLINSARVAQGIPALKENPQLAWSARAKNIYRSTYVQASYQETGKAYDPGHEVYDIEGRSLGWGYFIRKSGYQPTYVGENIAWSFPGAQLVFDAWMGSPGHRSNMLSPNFRDYGLSCILVTVAGREIPFWTQNFGG